jgi:hypothetical protein
MKRYKAKRFTMSQRSGPMTFVTIIAGPGEKAESGS